MEDLKRHVLEYFKDNKVDPNEVSSVLEDLKINVLDDMYGDEGEWVLKKLGKVESFDKEKIFNSIAQTSDEANDCMTQGDIDLIVNEVLKKMKSIKRNVYPTKEIRQYVKEALKNNNYNKVLDKYSKN
ncbi:MAG: ATP cone domain-containing protein [Lagierella massiliensis]|nr:ATP cone domain-containing protein [Lagierella massiliensis]